MNVLAPFLLCEMTYLPCEILNSTGVNVKKERVYCDIPS